MRAKQRTLSQKHQGHSLHRDFASAKDTIVRNRSVFLLEDSHPKEELSRFEDDYHPRPFRLDERIMGWEPHSPQADMRGCLFFQKEIKPHEKRPLQGRSEPINTRNFDKQPTKDTINYLKRMLFLLRSSREAAETEKLPLVQSQANTIAKKCLQKKRRRKEIALQSCQKSVGQKQNEYTDAQIINQLKHGLIKLPTIKSKKSTVNIRAKRVSKFTLDKLLV